MLRNRFRTVKRDASRSHRISNFHLGDYVGPVRVFVSVSVCVCRFTGRLQHHVDILPPGNLRDRLETRSMYLQSTDSSCPQFLPLIISYLKRDIRSIPARSKQSRKPNRNIYICFRVPFSGHGLSISPSPSSFSLAYLSHSRAFSPHQIQINRVIISSVHIHINIYNILSFILYAS